MFKKLIGARSSGDNDTEKFRKCIELLRQCNSKSLQIISPFDKLLKIVSRNPQLDPSFLDSLGEALEYLRKSDYRQFRKMVEDGDLSRVAIISKFIVNTTGLNPSTDLNAFSMLDEVWVPKVIAVTSKSYHPIGTTVNFGFISANFCFELWMKIDSANKSATPFHIFYCPDSIINHSIPSFKISENKLMIQYLNCQHSIPIVSNCFITWTHLCINFQEGYLVIYINGEQKLSTACHIMNKVIQYAICCGDGKICEARVWNCKRTPEDINAMMSISITPSSSHLFPGLRYAWLPTSTSTTGCLFYDVWCQEPVGKRLIQPTNSDNESMQALPPTLSATDSRWPCSLPPSLCEMIPADAAPWVTNYASEVSEVRERTELNRLRVASDPYQAYIQESLTSTSTLTSSSKREKSAQDIASQLVKRLQTRGGDGGGMPWLPRTVCFTSGVSAYIGSAEELGLFLSSSCTFTIESWVRVRTLSTSPNMNVLVGYTDAPGLMTSSTSLATVHGFFLGFRDGHPVCVLDNIELVAPGKISENQWIHIGVTLDTFGRLSMFINGNMVSMYPKVQFSNQSLQQLSNSLLSLSSTSAAYSLLGDVSEFRLWSLPLSVYELQRYMMQTIPLSTAANHHGLQLVWLPLKYGGIRSHQNWIRRQVSSSKRSSGSADGATTPSVGSAPATSSGHLTPTVLWDLRRQVDVGGIVTSSVTAGTGAVIPISRTRFPHVPNYEAQLVAASSIAPNNNNLVNCKDVALLDEWSDVFDYHFIPDNHWPDRFVMATICHENASATASTTGVGGSAIPSGSAVAYQQPNQLTFSYQQPGAPQTIQQQQQQQKQQQQRWIPRVVKFPLAGYASVLLGTTAGLGIENAGNGVAFTVEMFINYQPMYLRTTGGGSEGALEFQNILGHEEPEAVKKSGLSMIGLGKQSALRIGLANGHPYVSTSGKIHKLAESGAVVSMTALEKNVWSHVAFVCQSNGIWLIYVNGQKVGEISKPSAMPVTAKGDARIHAFGYANKSEFCSYICEFRLWSVARVASEIQQTMGVAIPPLPRPIIEESKTTTGSAYGGAVLGSLGAMSCYPTLRLSWLPLKATQTLFYDQQQQQHQASIDSPGNSSCSCFVGHVSASLASRRPFLLPPALLQEIAILPPVTSVDEASDCYEMEAIPTLLELVLTQSQSTSGVTSTVAGDVSAVPATAVISSVFQPFPGSDDWDQTHKGHWSLKARERLIGWESDLRYTDTSGSGSYKSKTVAVYIPYGDEISTGLWGDGGSVSDLK